MSVFSSGSELQDELVLFLTDFVNSDDGHRVAEQVAELADEATFVMHTLEPTTAVSVDFGCRMVTPGAMEGAAAEAQLFADDLHDLLLDRLGPVEISQLSERDRIGLTGTPDTLAALIIVATAIQPFYAASLERRERTHLLNTPSPLTGVVWRSDLPPKDLIASRRPWQGARRSSDPINSTM